MILSFQELSEDEMEEAKELVEETKEAFATSIVLMKLKQRPFPKSFFRAATEKLAPHLYYRAMATDSRDPSVKELAGFLADVHSMIGSSAHLERFFSARSWVHDVKRNRLSSDKAQKLTMLHRFLRVPEEEGDDDEDDDGEGQE
jgi:hypothetical protein